MHSDSPIQYKIVIALKDISSERLSKNEITCRVTIGDLSKLYKLPLKEALSFDVENLSSETKFDICFEKKGKVLERVKIPLPDYISNTSEIELEENFVFNCPQDDKKALEMQGKYYIIVLNKKLFKKSSAEVEHPISNTVKAESNSFSGELTPKLETKSVRPNSPKSPVMMASSQRSYLSSSQKVSPTHSRVKTSGVGQIYAVDSLDNMINKSVEKNAMELAKLDTDKKGIDECLYLNKVKNETASNEGNQLLNDSFSKKLEAQDTGRKNYKIGDTWEYREDFDLSPEHLKKKFGVDHLSDSQNLSRSVISKGRPGSPHTRKKNSNDEFELSAMTLENEMNKNNGLKSQIDYLKMIVYALDNKLRDYHHLKREHALQKLELTRSEEARKELQDTIKETTEDLRREMKSLHESYNKSLAEKSISGEKQKEVLKQLAEANEKLEKLDNLKRKLEWDVEQAQIQLKALSQVKSMNENLKNENKNLEKRLNEATDAFQAKIKEFQQLMSDHDRLRKEDMNERMKLQNEVNELRQALTNEKTYNMEKGHELEGLRRKLQYLQAQETVSKSLQETRNHNLKEISDVRAQNDNLNHLIESMRKEMSDSAKIYENREKKLLEQVSLLQKKMQSLEAENGQLSDQNLNLHRENSELRSNISSLEQLVCIKEDINKQLDFANEKLERLSKERDDLNEKLNALTDQLLLTNDKLFDANSMVSQLRGLLSEREEYALNLKKLILEMRENGSYIPLKDDPIDKKLAEFINNFNTHDRLKVLFLREGEGVYQFGSRRVYVKCEQDKIFIRVGGGFITIEDFLHEYTPLEMEKLSRNDPIKILSKNIAVNKTIAGRCVHEFKESKTKAVAQKSLGPVFSKAKPY